MDESTVLTWLKTQAIVRARRGIVNVDNHEKHVAKQFQAAADLLESYQTKLDEYEHRAKLHMDRCQHDMERIVALEQQNEALASRLSKFQKQLDDWEQAVKAGTPLGTLEGITELRFTLNGGEPSAVERSVPKGDRFTGTDCDFYEPGNGNACMNCGTMHGSE